MGNSWFKNNDVCNYTWLKMPKGRVVDKALLDYVLFPKRMLLRLVDVKVRRGKGGGMFNILLVGARLKLVGGRRSAMRV